MCPRCKKTHTNVIRFCLKPQKIRLTVFCCKVCGFIYAEDEEMLRAIRKHLHWVTHHNVEKELGIKNGKHRKNRQKERSPKQKL